MIGLVLAVLTAASVVDAEEGRLKREMRVIEKSILVELLLLSDRRSSGWLRLGGEESPEVSTALFLMELTREYMERQEAEPNHAELPVWAVVQMEQASAQVQYQKAYMDAVGWSRLLLSSQIVELTKQKLRRLVSSWAPRRTRVATEESVIVGVFTRDVQYEELESTLERRVLFRRAEGNSRAGDARMVELQQESGFELSHMYEVELRSS